MTASSDNSPQAPFAPIEQGAPIYALAAGGTARRQAIAVLRASGAGTGRILENLARRPLPAPRAAVVRNLYDPRPTDNQRMLDQAIVLWMPAPRSYTGEDSFELHLHGSTAVIDAVCAALGTLGAKPAEAGEFTRRAVSNQKMDVLQAEAVADLIEADTQAQADQALGQLGGGLSELAARWTDETRALLARCEALVDFPEETSPEIMDGLRRKIRALKDEIETLLAHKGGELVRDGVEIVLVGAPNAGKSALFNALLRDERAIVTPIAGTTRDCLVADVEIAGVKARLSDTAGLRKTTDPIEAEGVRRAKRRLRAAQIVLHLSPQGERRDDAEIHGCAQDAQIIRIRSKCDLDATSRESVSNEVPVSIRAQDGLSDLRETLERSIARMAGKRSGAAITRRRHREALEATARHLDDSLTQDDEALLGEDLRLALRAIGSLTGQVDCEMILGDIFGEFCIGK